jgi:hypothetical protein
MKEIIKEMWGKIPMKLRYGIFFFSGVMVVGTAWLSTSCSHLQNYPSDNLIEEIVEEVIESQTGQEIDLSPFSPEKKSPY